MGRVVARDLRDKVAGSVEIREHDGESATLLRWLEQADAAWLIDASASGADPGTIQRLDAHAGPLSSPSVSMSSHGLGLAEAIELGRVLGILPATCIIFTIEAKGFAMGQALSDPVSVSAREVEDSILAELANHIQGPGRRQRQ